MIHYLDPDGYVGVAERRTCPHHQKHPDDLSFAGCTCSGGWSQRPATPEEYRDNKRKRLTAEVERLRQQLEAVECELSAFDAALER